jgi:predicted naringenin-chalcone synthase
LPQYLTQFSSLKPDLCLAQQETIDWLVKYFPQEHSRDIQKYSISKNYIATRYFHSITGVGNRNEASGIYNTQQNDQPNLAARSRVAQETINEIFRSLYRSETVAPNDLLHVTCTHYQSPSGAQSLVSRKEWNSHTKVMHLYHMGCYASLPAIRVAGGLNSSGSKVVDIVHTELCSFHLDRDDCSIEQIIMRTLFADGSIKYSSLDEESFKKSGNTGFQVLGLHEEIVANSENEMTWKLSPTAFLMTLSRNVPKLISLSIESFLIQLFKQCGFDYHRDKSNFHFAIHPGGPEIIQLIQKKCDLTDQQVKYSCDVLRSRGNMSSATLPHVWDLALQDDEIKNVCSVAFGPGLTMTGALFKKC